MADSKLRMKQNQLWARKPSSRQGAYSKKYLYRIVHDCMYGKVVWTVLYSTEPGSYVSTM